MTATLEREGIFKARPVKWAVRKAESGAVSVNLQLLILAQLDGDDWVSWEAAEDHFVYGDFYVVKKDGKINSAAVERLVGSLGWDGDLRSVFGDPPRVVVQATVKADTYNGVTRYKASWLNPENYVPGSFGESEDDVKQLQARYGSLLRAAASGAVKAGAPKPAQAQAAAPGKASKAAPPAAKAPAPSDDDAIPTDDIPF